MTDNFAILVVGCKKHEEVARGYFELAKIYWPDSINKTFFCTDSISKYGFINANKIAYDSSDSFSKRILSGLKLIKSKYVILMLDDYYLTKRIDSNFFNSTIQLLERNNYQYCKLIGLPVCFKRNKKIRGTFFLKKTTHYGVSLQPSIWNKESLKCAIKKCTGASAWQVEAALSLFQADNYKTCLTFNKNVLGMKNGVLRGKLFPYTNKILVRNGIEPLKMDKISHFKWLSFSFKQHLAMHIPSFIRRFGKKIGTKTGKTYYSND